MAQSDVAIIAAGGTLWELLYMSCPVLSFARNSVQGSILESLHKKGIVQNLGTPHQYQAARLARVIEEFANLPDQRARMSELGRQQVDGEGARRVCDVLAASK
jgi:spore coat polysaccharide biosynthesis predicted glycosyltransferase SpsG